MTKTETGRGMEGGGYRGGRGWCKGVRGLWEKEDEAYRLNGGVID